MLRRWRPRFSLVDVVVFVAVALLLFGILRLARAVDASDATAYVAVISTSPYELPCYAARSLLRLREMMGQFRVPWKQKWKQKWRELILPGIFPYYVPILEDISLQLHAGEVVALLAHLHAGPG